MFKPLVIGLPFILIVALAFGVGMNVLPFGSPYLPYVIGGYAVLMAVGLFFTIGGTIRAAKRAMQGGDPELQARGRRARARVIAVRPSSMTMRVGGGLPLRLLHVVLEIDDDAFGVYELKVMKTLRVWDLGPGVGMRVPVFVDPANKDNVFVVWAEGEPRAGTNRANAESMTSAARTSDLSQEPAGRQQASDMADPARPVREPGRARIEALQPNPDGTYELDLFVSPKTRPSYRLTIALAVPQEHAGRMRKGQYFAALLDPDVPETIEIDWDKL